MSQRALGPQFIDHKQLSEMYSGDFDEPMVHTLANLRHDYEDFRADSSDDPHPDPGNYGVHAKDFEHGGPDNYIAHLKADIAKNGIKEPLEVRGGNVVTEGHHRAVAAMQLGLSRIPLKHRD